MEPSRTASRAVRTIRFEAVSTNLDAPWRTSFCPGHQARLFARTRDILTPPRKKRQPPTSTEKPAPLQYLVVLLPPARRFAGELERRPGEPDPDGWGHVRGSNSDVGGASGLGRGDSRAARDHGRAGAETLAAEIACSFSCEDGKIGGTMLLIECKTLICK